MASTFETTGRPSRQDALDYHSSGRRGKIEVVPTKPVATSRDLSLAYSPGVAEPCLEIARDPDLSYKYTARGNLVAVVSNGTAVLGLGDIGAYASKPVMEGKGVLFKKFADIDVFDIEVDAKDIDTFCKVVKALEPTFGGVNLEDVKSPECFVIERRLRSEMQIPVFHDDQHGTAIITGAALINAVELAGKRIQDVKVVFVGAGAAAVACAEQYVKLGVPREHIFMCDKFGLVYRGRPEDMDEWKGVFAQGAQPRTLSEVIKGADVVVGLSASGVISKEMVATLAPDPILFALANPVPEILPEEAQAVRSDVIMATGPQRLSQPGQQRPGLSRPLPRRPRRAREGDQRRDEAGRLARAGGAGAAGRPGERERGVRRADVHVWPRLHHSQAVRPTCVDRGCAGSGAGSVRVGCVARVTLEREHYVEALRRRQGRTYEVMSVVVARARRRMTRIAFPKETTRASSGPCSSSPTTAICTPVLLGKRAEILERGAGGAPGRHRGTWRSSTRSPARGRPSSRRASMRFGSGTGSLGRRRSTASGSGIRSRR